MQYNRRDGGFFNITQNATLLHYLIMNEYYTLSTNRIMCMRFQMINRLITFSKYTRLVVVFYSYYYVILGKVLNTNISNFHSEMLQYIIFSTFK